MGAAKSVHRGKFIAFNGFIRKDKRFKVSGRILKVSKLNPKKEITKSNNQ